MEYETGKRVRESMQLAENAVLERDQVSKLEIRRVIRQGVSSILIGGSNSCEILLAMFRIRSYIRLYKTLDGHILTHLVTRRENAENIY